LKFARNEKKRVYFCLFSFSRGNDCKHALWIDRSGKNIAPNLISNISVVVRVFFIVCIKKHKFEGKGTCFPS